MTVNGSSPALAVAEYLASAWGRHCPDQPFPEMPEEAS